ncbi:hypothetical protein B0T24DRAFT_591810 [Lasiosphaeria ovina]|uniref:Protein kinase domain-containing protein n=1 Tax=Lasiosphaeria ovina TaxID=92902 RepID=A0AAE0KH30_9PEZI|nr:hypothetical protein B0T24DRAFT_591810 [Lasiosphaeria ovina]
MDVLFVVSLLVPAFSSLPSPPFVSILHSPFSSSTSRHVFNSKSQNLLPLRTASWASRVGFHVSTRPRGRVITRLGRDADLILSESNSQKPMSAVHVAFELNPTTHLLVLTARSKHLSSISLRLADNLNGKKVDMVQKKGGEIIVGDGVVLYGWGYVISIAAYKFEVIWRDLSNDYDHLPIDKASGNAFAIKVIDLTKHNRRKLDAARAILHREVKVMETLRHANIVEYLGNQFFHTSKPEIFMSLREGSLTELITSPGHTLDLD